MTRASTLHNSTAPPPPHNHTAFHHHYHHHHQSSIAISNDKTTPGPTSSTASTPPGPYFIIRSRIFEARYTTFKGKTILFQPVKFFPVSLQRWLDCPREHAAQEERWTAEGLHAGRGDGERGRVHGRRCGRVVELFGMKEFVGAETPELRNWAREFRLKVVMHPASFPLNGVDAETTSSESSGTPNDSKAATDVETADGDDYNGNTDYEDDNHDHDDHQEDDDYQDDGHNDSDHQENEGDDDDDDQWEDAESVISEDDSTSSSDQAVRTAAAVAAVVAAAAAANTATTLSEALSPELDALEQALNLWAHELARPSIAHALLMDPGGKKNDKDKHLLVAAFTAGKLDTDVRTITSNGVRYTVLGCLRAKSLQLHCEVEKFRSFFSKVRGGEGGTHVKLVVWDGRKKDEDGGEGGDGEGLEEGEEEAARETRKRDKKRRGKRTYLQRKRERRCAGDTDASTADQTLASEGAGSSSSNSTVDGETAFPPRPDARGPSPTVAGKTTNSAGPASRSWAAVVAG